MISDARYARIRYREALGKKAKPDEGKLSKKRKAKELLNKLQAKRAALKAQSQAEDELLRHQMLEVRKVMSV